MIKAGTANKGMVAKLEACRSALRHGVGDVLIANGRECEFGQLAAASAARRRARRWCDEEADVRRHQSDAKRNISFRPTSGNQLRSFAARARGSMTWTAMNTST